MVKKIALIFILIFFEKPSFLLALNEETHINLQILEDHLRFEMQKNPGLVVELLPTLVATPIPYWQSSEKDFSVVAWAMLKNIFKDQTTDLLLCSDCSQQRTFVNHNGHLTVNNGDLTLLELNHLKEQPSYKSAKTLLTLKETPSGVELRMIRLSDGQILYSKLASQDQNLLQEKAPLHLAQELERRQSGKSLSYVFIDWGLYPAALLQFEMLEQWGARNQNLSGLVISIIEPNVAIGGTFHYLLPANRKLNFSGSAFMTLEGLMSSAKSSKKSPWTIVVQGMAQYAISGNYAVFGTINSKGTVTMGVSFLNPVLFPFLF